MSLRIRKYIPSIVTAVLGVLVILIIPAQIDLSRVRSGNITGVNSRVIPYVLSISIVALSVLELILSRIKKEGDDSSKLSDHPDNKSYARVLVTGAAILLWIFLMPVLGFVVSMSMLMISIMVLMGNKRWIVTCAVSIITSVTLWFVFTNFIGRSLPSGLFF